jgi:hypothetical protein
MKLGKKLSAIDSDDYEAMSALIWKTTKGSVYCDIRVNISRMISISVRQSVFNLKFQILSKDKRKNGNR